MTIQFTNGEDYYNKIYQVFNISVAITLLPFGYLVLEKHSGHLVNTPLDSWLFWSYTVPIIIGIFLTMRWSHHQLKRDKELAAKKPTLRNKLEFFYKLLLKRFLTFTIISTICVIMLYVTGSGIFIVIYVIAMGILSFHRPTLNLIIQDLKLSKEDEQILVEKKDIA